MGRCIWLDWLLFYALVDRAVEIGPGIDFGIGNYIVGCINCVDKKIPI